VSVVSLDFGGVAGDRFHIGRVIIGSDDMVSAKSSGSVNATKHRFQLSDQLSSLSEVTELRVDNNSEKRIEEDITIIYKLCHVGNQLFVQIVISSLHLLGLHTSLVELWTVGIGGVLLFCRS